MITNVQSISIEILKIQMQTILLGDVLRSVFSAAGSHIYII
jgi:hypothetical protein